jgi:hypothetical protein
MNWRGKAIAVGLALGVGFTCVRPLLIHSIERRISGAWCSKTELGDAKISLSHGTLALSDLSIAQTRGNLSIEKVLMRFDPKELWYRNCIVESLMGTGLRWEFTEKQTDPSRATTDSLAAWSSLGKEDLENKNGATELLFQSVSQQIQKMEQESVVQSQRTDQRLVRLRSKLTEAEVSEKAANPLRPNNLLNEMESEILQIQQALAEERVQSRSLEKQLIAAVKQSNDLIATLEVSPAAIDSMVDLLSRSILEEVAQGFVGEIQSYLDASEELFLRLAPPQQRQSNSLQQGYDLELPGLQTRETRIVRGRVLGDTMIERRREKTEIVFVRRNPSSDDRACAMNILWETSDKSVFPLKKTKLTMQSKPRREDGWSVALSQQGEHGERVYWMSQSGISILRELKMPSAALFRTETAQGLQLNAEFNDPGNRSLHVSFTRSEQLGITASREWALDDQSLTWLKGLLRQKLQADVEHRKNQTRQSMLAHTEQEKSRLQGQLLALDSRVKERQKTWSKELVSLSRQLQSMNETLHRTSRKALSLTR